MSCIFILLLAFSCCCVLCNGARGPDRDRYSARRNSSLGEGERPREPRLLRVFGLARTLALPGLGCEVRKTHGYSLVRSSTRARPVSRPLIRVACRSKPASTSRWLASSFSRTATYVALDRKSTRLNSSHLGI